MENKPLAVGVQVSLSSWRDENLIFRISLMLAESKRESNRGIFQETVDKEGLKLNKLEINRLGRGWWRNGEGVGEKELMEGIQEVLHIGREKEL